MPPELRLLVALSAVSVGCTGEIIESPKPDGAEPASGIGDSPQAAPTRFECKGAPATSRIQKLSNRVYVASLGAIVSDFAPTLLSNPSLVGLLAQLPNDLESGRETTEVLASQQVSLYADVAFRVGTLLGQTPAALHALPGTSGCLSQAPVSPTCFDGFVSELGRRILRRPVTAAERTALLALSNDPAAQSTADKVTLVVAALLQAPDFLYEIYDAQPFDAFSYASRLSLILTGAPPDASLRAAADDGTLLSDVSVAAAQVDRLLATGNGHQMVLRFFREWMRYDAFDAFTYPHAVAAGLDTSHLQADMVAEVEALLTDVTFSHRTVGDLLTTPETRFDSAALAQVYGITNPSGVKAMLPQARRAGLLTRAAFLSKRSGTMTSPVLRGKLVLTQLLCATVSPPPASVVPVLTPLMPGEYLTTRDHLARTTEVPGSVCANCHTHLNHLGFPLEHYDTLGRYRDREDMFDEQGNPQGVSLPVDSKASSVDLDVAPVTVDDAVALSAQLATNVRVLRCTAQRWQEFLARRDAVAADGCVMNDSLDVLAPAAGPQGSLYDLVKQSVLSPSFKQWSN
jgi:hypothetical protein